jgi:hypothetical protein
LFRFFTEPSVLRFPVGIVASSSRKRFAFA